MLVFSLLQIINLSSDVLYCTNFYIQFFSAANFLTCECCSSKSLTCSFCYQSIIFSFVLLCHAVFHLYISNIFNNSSCNADLLFYCRLYLYFYQVLFISTLLSRILETDASFPSPVGWFQNLLNLIS